jgi:hypothetical protein
MGASVCFTTAGDPRHLIIINNICDDVKGTGSNRKGFEDPKRKSSQDSPGIRNL